MNWITQAVEKLEREAAAFRGNQYEAAMKTAVLEALTSFCRQTEEFAQAVVQGGGFGECMAAVAKGVGRSISDIEAYRRAAAFYSRGAEVKMELRIQLEPEVKTSGKIIALEFSDFFS